MTILRSREVLSTKPKLPLVEPATPTRSHETFTIHHSPPELDSGSISVRRSSRLASRSVSEVNESVNKLPDRPNRRSNNKVRVSEVIEEKSAAELPPSLEKGKRKIIEGEIESGGLSLRSGKRVAKIGMASDGENQSRGEGRDLGTQEMERQDVPKTVQVVEAISTGEVKVESGGLSLRSGKRVVTIEIGSGGENEARGEEKDLKLEVMEGEGVSNLVQVAEETSIGEVKASVPVNDGGSSRKRKYSREEKGKAKVEDISLNSKQDNDTVSPGLGLEINDAISAVITKLVDASQVSERRVGVGGNRTRTEIFHATARENASRFAYFDPQNDNITLTPAPVERETANVEAEKEPEDWPGPFSTAMNIIRDRTQKMNMKNPSTGQTKSKPSIWIPKNFNGNCKKMVVPSLKELSLKILVKNVDAITSLDCVPDALRHKLSQMLCDSRQINSHFLDLLLSGSPTEIRIRDCSWISEEQFTTSFEGCDTSNLMVLQLDQSGRCIPDYVLLSTIARSPKRLPALTKLSLKGACRLSDIGLNALIASAPALRSINLNQCSLLTSASIDTLAESLGSSLCELCINDCQSIDAMSILSALMNLHHLEVLSVQGNPTVCDDFVREYVFACGHHLKELVLTDCTKLTDSSVQAIAENCPQLLGLNLVNLCNLTDSTLVYLANGCQRIQTLLLSRNRFSDEAVAAFLETSGDHLKELSLNSIRLVGRNTALSLAKCSRKLRELDLSFCRNMADEEVGLIVDSCLSLKVLKLFGCTQITDVFLDGHSNPELQIIGLKMSDVLDHLKLPDPEEGPLLYSEVPLPV